MGSEFSILAEFSSISRSTSTTRLLESVSRGSNGQIIKLQGETGEITFLDHGVELGLQILEQQNSLFFGGVVLYREDRLLQARNFVQYLALLVEESFDVSLNVD